ncbi:hypothetical protein SAMN05444170_6917 [Bradyrhizobium erythrophlei]|uniref:Uncharacterized protein n=2 Tax=Bradyrhizobium erythrophlei TaxID=1437360 RepID=A0A1M7UVC4_9BRAD|nr:hypothetical protein SAMN05444170_6917 [Bradyrhizobium erythrophlei]
MLRGSMPNKTLVAMQRADGSLDSECVIKPDHNGVVMVPAEHVISMMKAGYVHTTSDA